MPKSPKESVQHNRQKKRREHRRKIRQAKKDMDATLDNITGNPSILAALRALDRRIEAIEDELGL